MPDNTEAPNGDRNPAFAAGIAVSNTGDPASLKLIKTQVVATSAAYEPSIKVDSKGKIYVTAAQASFTQASRLWTSRDGGQAFEEIPVASPQSGARGLPLGLEGDLAIDAADQAYFIDLTHLAGTTVARSTDRGATWLLRNPNPFLQPGGDRPWVAAGAKDLVAVTWQHLATGMWVAVSTDGGLTFKPTFVEGYGAFRLPGTVNNNWSSSGPIVMASDGTIYVARSYYYAYSGDLGPHVLRSTDGGATFTRHAVHSSKNLTRYPFVVPAVDNAGTVYVAWAENVADNVDVFYAYSLDKGTTWSLPRQVSSHQGSSVLPWIAAGAAGHVALAYYGAPSTPGEPATTEGDWFPFAAEITGASTTSPKVEAMQVTSTPIKGPICADGIFCTGNRELLDYLMVDIGPQREIHVAWGTKQGSVSWSLLSSAG